MVTERERDVWFYSYKNIVNGSKEIEIIYRQSYFYFSIMFKWQICYAEMTDL